MSAPTTAAADALRHVVTTTAEGVTFTWQVAAPAAANVSSDQAENQAAMQKWAAALQQLPQQPVGEWLLPMQLETVLLPRVGEVLPQIQQLTSAPWSGVIPQADPLVPPVIDGQSLPEPILKERQRLPTAPLFLLREGRLRGQRVGVIALSPLYVEAGVTKIALDLRATLAGARALPALPNADADAVLDLTTFTNQPVMLDPLPSGPTNPLAAQNAYKIQVTAAGIQQVRGDALLAAGLPEKSALASLQLLWQGKPLPLEIHDGDGLLDPTTELRFYAQPADQTMQVGNRWSITDTYWLANDPNDLSTRLRMATRKLFPRLAPLRQSAFQHGIWEENQIYESNMAGIDGDHWFSAKMEIGVVDPTDPAPYPTTSITLTHALPLDYGSEAPSVFTLTGSARSAATHTLDLNLGEIVQTLTWSNDLFFEDWQHTFTQTVQTDRLDLVLLAGRDPSMIRIDKLAWRQPVLLDFQEQGANFQGVAGLWRYQLQNVPADRTLYDITDPTAPVVLQIPTGPQTQFEDGPAAHDYLLAASSDLYHPTVAPNTPFQLDTIEGADAVYIAPAWLHDELAPLLEHRRQQGYQVQLMDVQQIYDAWSYGQVDPTAIRDFLRYAVSHWRPAPMAAILVGDSSVDPRNYTGSQNGMANVNIVPAYWAPIDPWIGETACEACFAQLDGASPLDEEADPAFLEDIWLGRLSVQDEAQLTTVVDKILRYEASAQRDAGALWHHTALYIADNYILPNGTKDSAGNFPYLSDLISQGDPSSGIGAVQPVNVITRRLYYDPSANGITETWREPNAEEAHLRTIDEINQGPGLVTYNGHGNHFLWATTDPNFDPPYLFGTNDIFELTNVEQPFILLEMTCYTAQFTYLSPSGYTIDERFLRHTNGGAVAVWGSAGLTVAVGHDWMQQGFHRKLWKAPAFQARLGELTAAGYMNLFASTTCCQATRYVYLLLGDPLTPALLWAPQDIYLPLVTR
ncbi:MAG: C25 family cysteine peptidase [Caldilineaceae bacterium]